MKSATVEICFQITGERDYRRMTGEQRMAIVNELNRLYKIRWWSAIHRRFPDATKLDLRGIVVRHLLRKSARERGVNRGRQFPLGPEH